MKAHAATALRWLDFPLATLRWLLRGEACLDDFRQRFAASLGVEPGRVHLFGSGRAALYAYVDSLGLPADAEVLLPGYTCAVVPNVFEHLGLKMRYVDIEAGGFNPSAAAIAAAIGPATRLVLLPHNFGLALNGIAGLRERFPDVVFVEDAAHAWGSRDAEGRVVGTLGHAAFFSFEYSKPLSTGLGGALLVNEAAASTWMPPARHRPASAAVAKQALTLAWHRLVQTLPAPLLSGLKGLLRAPSRRLGVVADTPVAELQGAARPDYRLGLHSWSAALGERQARRATEVWAARRAQARAYDALLPAALRAARGEGDVLLRYPLRLPKALDRGTLTAALARDGIELGCWFDDVVHPRGSLRPGYTAGDCPVGEATANCVANLPLGLHARLSARQARALQARLST